MANAGEIKKGIVMNYKNELWLVVDFQFVSPGKGSAFVRTKIKSLKTGKVIENTFKSNETVEFEDVLRKKMQYLYIDGDNVTFMDSVSYEQVSVPKSEISDLTKYLKEGIDVTVIMHGDNPITIEIPQKITYEVKTAPPAVKGDTASGNVTKEVELENGLNVQAPIFIQQGDKIVVNTETGQYVERAN